ncbi:MAG: response regulator [Clostridiaceae bacterium]
MAINLLIADDDGLIRESLKIILGLDSEFNIVSVAQNGKEAVDSCKSNKIDVALLDIRMPVLDGVEAVKEITSSTSTKCLILTTFEEEDYIKRAISYGAKGYILKNNSPEEIKNAIKLVYNGTSVMQDQVMEVLKDNFSNKSNFNGEMFTTRELDIIESIAEGLSNKEIAQKLFISEGTVKNYITSILEKTNLNHRTQIAILYLKGNV